MKKNLSLELLLRDEVQHLLDSFAALMKIQAVFFAADGRILKRGRTAGNSPYCRLMQQKYFSSEQCAALDRAMQQKCDERGRPICYTCHAGLNELIAPVKIYGICAGYLILGQFRTGMEVPPLIALDSEAQEHFLNLPYIAPDEIGNLENMLQVMIEYIVERELVSYSEDLRYRKIIYFLDKHFAREITLRELARYIGCSESSLTHYLRKEYRTSFKQLLIEKRLSEAEKLWKESPSTTIAETAAQVGYNDHHYFSRLYHNVRGKTPGEFRKNFSSKIAVTRRSE